MRDSRRSRVLIRFMSQRGRPAIEPGYKHAGISFDREFVVHYPSAEQGAMAWFCGTRSGRDTDKIKEANLSLINSVAVHVPTIEGVTVAFECRVVGQFEIGDHTVFVGEVVAIRSELQTAEHLYVTSNTNSLA